MPRLPLRSFTPALVCAGLLAGMIATTGGAQVALADAPAARAAADRATTISAPLTQITSRGQDALESARQAVAAARTVTVDIATSGLPVSGSTTVDTTALRGHITKLGGLELMPTMLIPALTADAESETQAVRERTAALRGKLDAAIQKKAEEEAAAAAQAAAEAAAAQAAAEAAAAQAAAEQAAAEAAAAQRSSSSSSGGSWAPSVNVNVDPASAQGIARSMMASSYGWGDDQFACLVSLWDRESGWNAAAYNAGSGAYGIPQALPGSKMASAGADWETNPATQIAWGLGYISGRYGTPCGAWGHSQSSGWY